MDTISNPGSTPSPASTSESKNAPGAASPAQTPVIADTSTPVFTTGVSQRPAGGDKLQSARQGAHAVVDAAADKAAPVIDAVHSKVEGAKAAASTAKDAAAGGEQTLKDALGKASDSADEWIGAARDVIRANPLAAIGGAVLIGAALIGLASRRR